MSRYKVLSLVAFCVALLAGGGLVALAGKGGPALTAAPVLPPKVDFVAELVADTLGVRPVETEASGRVEFTLLEGGDALAYRITVSALEDAFMSHLHLGGPEDRYGSLVVWLWPAEGKRREVREGRFDGVLHQGEIRAENLTGALAKEELAELLAAIRAGRIFADIHTRRNVPGELRGQVLVPSP
ncbi:MAG: CHRD domain-containing protein [Desulfurivibrio sp.]